MGLHLTSPTIGTPWPPTAWQLSSVEPLGDVHLSFILVDMPFGRRDQVLEVLRGRGEPLDDDEIADLAGINRVYVNALCRALAEDGLIVRRRGAGGKLVNVVVADGRAAEASRAGGSEDAVLVPRTRMRFSDTQADRIESLIAGFGGWVSVFENSAAFPGPSQYFHERAIARRRQHQAVDSLLSDIRFLEYVYAVLPAWGMHRMGPQSAKVGDFTQITTALRDKAAALEQLWPLRITALDTSAACDAAALAWQIIEHIRVSTSRTQIVAGSKFLHHLLPDLVAPIDRRYTFRFFTGYGAVTSDRASFLDWFPKLASIGNRCRVSIYDVIGRGGFMATGQAKVIDNAIIGFIQNRQTRQRSALPGVGVDDRSANAAALFEEAIAWLSEHYSEFEFWVERDLVWTVQSRLRKIIGDRGLHYAVFNDYPMLPGPRRARSADLVVRDLCMTVLVAAEFKYEPSHSRAEFLTLPTNKFPIVDWGNEGVVKDITRIREFVALGGARTAFAVLIDEGRYFRHRPAHPGSEWRDWAPARPADHQPSVLWARWPPG